ncbi:hypothetical protein Q3G72_003327 [Acer saccharum]|nr:hypothetical protein Q3G72_003327 [Acer saccharum]
MLSPFQFFFLSVFLVSGFSLSSSRSNNVSIPDDDHISLTRSPLEASCPLNFDSLRKLVHESPPRPVLIDMPSQCKGMFRAVLVLRSEYLRTNGYFLPPPDTTEECWQSFRSLISEFIKGFDIQTSCRDYPESMSETCYNITSQAEFESQIPAEKMQEIWHYCNQSLDTDSACDSCTSKLSSLGDYYSQVPGTGNVSVCTGYAAMYAAAIVNHLGPTDRATMRCLFALNFPSKPSGFKPHKIIFWAVLSGSVILGILGAFSAVWFCWTRLKKPKKLQVPVRYDTSSEFGSGLYARGSNLVRFKFQEIKEATRNFSMENIIGKGAYGNVYKGNFPDGTEVAFKRFKNCSVACDASFKHEVEVIASIRHVNLVALRGYCTKTLPMEDWAWGLVNEGRALDVIDEKIPEMLLPELMKQYVLIAALCVHPILEARPTMDQIVKILETDLSINHKVPPGAYAASPSRDVIDFGSDSMKSSETTDESVPSVMLIVE